MLDVVIVGGGLSGLSLAQRLHRQQRTFALFEAGDRFGGRILSRSHPGSQQGAPDVFRNDLGPSWVWPDEQQRIAAFVLEHGLKTYPQWQQGKSLYHSDRQLAAQSFVDRSTYANARRIAGGSYSLIETLLAQLPAEALHLQHRLLALTDCGDHVELKFDNPMQTVTLKARRAVLTIPPRLLLAGVEFEPALNPRLQQLMSDTATWMAGHAKAVISYAKPFWRQADFSGNAYANYRGAALAEIFDACSESGELAALSGFFALPAALRRHYQADLEALIVEQLVRLFGPEAAYPTTVVIQDWFAEPYTATPEDEMPPPSHPQYGHPWLQLDHWNDKLFFGGTETATEFGGYLEGALAAAERVATALLVSDRCKTT